jgi:MFS family permease
MSILLSLSFFCSIGTGIVTNGVYFLTKKAYDFDRTENYKLGVVLGVTYILAATFSGRIVRKLSRLFSARGLLALVIVLLGLLCFVPLASRAALEPSPKPQQWPLWVMVAIYSPLTGILWPVIEGYISGGRSGDSLRRALGTWNLWWSAAVVLGFWLMGPLLGSATKPGLLSPYQLIAFLGVVHIASTVLVLKLGPEPGRHIHEERHPHPPVYKELLGTFRILLPTSYLVQTSLAPYLPLALLGLGIDAQWTAPLASTWTFARVFSFLALDRWQGWHGRWFLAIASITLLLGGFALVVLGPVALSGPPAIACTLAGLVAFGIGISTTYTAALYYAMEVGQSEVDAGGTHESLIGIGYTAGPALGLLAGALVPSEGKPGAFELRVLLIVGGLALFAFIAAAIKTHFHTRVQP